MPVETKEKFIHIRVKDPDDFIAIRTITISASRGIKALVGRLKSDPKGGTTVQSFMFDKGKWTVDRAKAWVSKHEKASVGPVSFWDDATISFGLTSIEWGSSSKLELFEDYIAAMKAQGVDVLDTASRAVFTARPVHALPRYNVKKRAFTKKTLRRSFGSFALGVVDIEHRLRVYKQVKEEEIAGMILASAMPEDQKDPAAIYILGAVWKKVSAAKRILTPDTIAAVGEWMTSMEVDRDPENDAFLVGDKFVPLREAPIDLLKCYSPYDIASYEGKRTLLCLGGEDGKVDFDGCALTEHPADDKAELLSLTASAIREEDTKMAGDNFVPFMGIRAMEFASAEELRWCPTCGSQSLEEFCCAATIEIESVEIAKRPTTDFIIPANHPKCKDKSGHFPIPDEDHARNALARVAQFSSAPKWWSGTLAELVSLVKRAVKRKFKKIEVSDVETAALEVIGRVDEANGHSHDIFSDLEIGIENGHSHWPSKFLVDTNPDGVVITGRTSTWAEYVGNNQNPIVHQHTFKIAKTTKEGAEMAKISKFSVANDKPLAWLAAVKKILGELEASALNSEDKGERELYASLVDLNKQVGSFDLEAAVTTALNDRISKGELFTKQGAEDLATQKVNEYKQAQEAAANKAKEDAGKIANRLESAKKAGIKIDVVLEKASNDKPAVTVENRIKDFPLTKEGDTAFELFVASVKSIKPTVVPPVGHLPETGSSDDEPPKWSGKI